MPFFVLLKDFLELPTPTLLSVTLGTCFIAVTYTILLGSVAFRK